MLYPNGESFEGEFFHGERHGKGVYRSASGVVKFDGQWNRDRFVSWFTCFQIVNIIILTSSPKFHFSFFFLKTNLMWVDDLVRTWSYPSPSYSPNRILVFLNLSSFAGYFSFNFLFLGFGGEVTYWIVLSVWSSLCAFTPFFLSFPTDLARSLSSSLGWEWKSFIVFLMPLSLRLWLSSFSLTLASWVWLMVSLSLFSTSYSVVCLLITTI